MNVRWRGVRIGWAGGLWRLSCGSKNVLGLAGELVVAGSESARVLEWASEAGR